MISRDDALRFILQHERQAERLAITQMRKHFLLNEHLPAGVRSKFLGAGGEYGSFQLQQDWLAHLESEIWDAKMYAGLELYRREMFE